MTDNPGPAPVSLLYVPAHKPRAIAKARTLDVDMAILDLEDAVPTESKAEAREIAAQALAEGFDGKAIALRVNAGEAMAEDLAVLARGGCDYVVVPKISSPADLPVASPLPVLAMIETPAAILNLSAIAGDARVAGLIAGLNDLAEELRLPDGVDRSAMGYGLQAIVMAARAHGVWCFDGVCNAIDDAEACAAQARDGHRLGFDGKTLIHPGQVEGCNRAWLPDPAALAEARRMVAAAEGGAERFEGRMIEAMHVAAARRLIACGDLSGQG